MLFLETCGACGSAGSSLCDACEQEILRLGPGPATASLDGFTVQGAIWYEGAGRRIITELKYRGHRDAVAWLAASMAPLLRSFDDGIDLVTWVPSSRQGRRHRGFDCGRLLARRIARDAHLRSGTTLTRAKGVRQSSKSRRQRWEEAPTFSLRRRDLWGKRILLVDDVCTTGASITACRSLLMHAGACDVRSIVAAITPSPTIDVATRRSVVESRCQSQAKRPT